MCCHRRLNFRMLDSDRGKTSEPCIKQTQDRPVTSPNHRRRQNWPPSDACHPKFSANFLHLQNPPSFDCIPSLNHPPLILLQVCSSWRSIALATPDLWTDLCILLSYRIPPKDSAVLRQYEELASQWFSRAGPDLPLSLQFDSPICESDHDFSNIILSRPKQFRGLKIRVRDPNSLAAFTRGNGDASSAFSQLEDLTISWYEPAFDVTFAAAGHLRRMNAWVRFNSWPERENFAPWKQLTCLEIGLLDRSVWVPLFAQCINLENGTFAIDSNVDDPVPIVNVTMAHLTSLTVDLSPSPSEDARFGANDLGHLLAERFSTLVQRERDAWPGNQ
jgi:hypothetical protein